MANYYSPVELKYAVNETEQYILFAESILSGKVTGSPVPALCWKCDLVSFSAIWKVSCNP